MKIDLKKISDEILQMGQDDQRVLQTGDYNRIKQTQKKNTQRLKQIISEYGFPTITKVGEQASFWSWLIIQHSDHDVEFQKECLEQMKTFSSENIRPKNIAYLEDRVRKNQKLPQIYGTQFIKNEKGDWEIWQLESPRKLNKLREQMGLEPFKKYHQDFMDLHAIAK